MLAVSADADKGRAAVGALEDALLGTLPEQLAMLQRMLTPAPISYDTLPQALRERMVSTDGRLRVEIAPAEDLTDEAALARFIESVRAVAPQATGGAVGVYEGKRAIVHAFQQAFGLAVVTIALLLLGLWLSVADAALAIGATGAGGDIVALIEKNLLKKLENNSRTSVIKSRLMAKFVAT